MGGACGPPRPDGHDHMLACPVFAQFFVILPEVSSRLGLGNGAEKSPVWQVVQPPENTLSAIAHVELAFCVYHAAHHASARSWCFCAGARAREQKIVRACP